MRNSLRLLVSASLLGLAVSAHAATISAGSYNLEDAYVLGDAVTGTVTFNSSGDATNVDLSFLDPSYSSTAIIFGSVSSATTYDALGQDYFTVTNLGGGQITLYFDNSSTAGGDFDLCIGSADCGTSGAPAPSTLQTYGYSVSGPPYYVGGFGPDDFTSGYLVAAGTSESTSLATPEPSSLLLLGTGLLGLGALARRKHVTAL